MGTGKEKQSGRAGEKRAAPPLLGRRINGVSREKAIGVTILHNGRAARNGFLALLNATAGFVCLGTHARLDSFLAKGAASVPDVVLVDVDAADRRTCRELRKLRLLLPETRLLALIPAAELGLVMPLLEAGAAGCLLKPVPPVELLAAIAEVHDAGTAVSPEVAHLLVETVRKRGAARQCLEGLSRRESQVLERLSKGCLTKEIAAQCSISVETVNSHLRHIYDKLHVHSRAAAVGKFLGQMEG